MFGTVLQIARAEGFRGGARHAVQSTNTATAWRSSPATATPPALRQPRQYRHGRHQRADPGAGGLSQLRRLEASAFGDTKQHGIEGVRFYTKVKTVTAAGRRASAETRAS